MTKPLPKGALNTFKPTPEMPDPLAQAVAARMIGQLNAMANLPGMGPLSKVNLPAAYAGDQRSLQAAQRAINEAETGLQSPGRRKMMKQSAAMAARQAVPDVIANAVGTSVLKKAAQDAVAPAPAYDQLLAAMVTKLRESSFGDDEGLMDALSGGQLDAWREAVPELQGLPDKALDTLWQEAEHIEGTLSHVEDMLSNGFYGKYMFRELPGFGYGPEGAKQLKRLPEFDRWYAKNYTTPTRQLQKLGITPQRYEQLMEELYPKLVPDAEDTLRNAFSGAFDSALEHAEENVFGLEALPAWYRKQFE